MKPDLVYEDCLLTVPEAAEVLSISVRKLYRLIGEGEFPPVFKIGRLSRVRKMHVMDYINRKK